MSGPRHTRTAPGDVLSAISDGLVGLQKEFYGRGPSETKSYYVEDLVVCVLRGGFTRVEETLLGAGRADAVLRQRREFQALMRDRYEATVEHATGRPVVGFMGGHKPGPRRDVRGLRARGGGRPRPGRRPRRGGALSARAGCPRRRDGPGAARAAAQPATRMSFLLMNSSAP